MNTLYCLILNLLLILPSLLIADNQLNANLKDTGTSLLCNIFSTANDINAIKQSFLSFKNYIADFSNEESENFQVFIGNFNSTLDTKPNVLFIHNTIGFFTEHIYNSHILNIISTFETSSNIFNNIQLQLSQVADLDITLFDNLPCNSFSHYINDSFIKNLKESLPYFSTLLTQAINSTTSLSYSLSAFHYYLNNIQYDNSTLSNLLKESKTYTSATEENSQNQIIINFVENLNKSWLYTIQINLLKILNKLQLTQELLHNFSPLFLSKLPITSNISTQQISSSGEQEDYESAFANIENSDFHQAIYDFNNFITNYPTSSLKFNAYYWLGETYYSLQNYIKAYESFGQAIKISNYDADKKFLAMLKMSLSLKQLQSYQQACIILLNLKNFSKENSVSKHLLYRLESEIKNSQQCNFDIQ